MARAPNEKVIEARKLYDKGNKLIDISKKLDIPEGTIRSWKNRYKWGCDNNATLHKIDDRKRNVAKEKTNSRKKEKEVVTDEIKEVLENEALSDKQRLFCVIYSRCLNATNAYQEAYKCTYETAMVNGCNLLRNTKIKEQIEKLNAVEFNKEFIKRSVIQKYIDIALADISKFAKFGKRDKIQYDSNGQPIMEDGKLKTYEESYLELKESDRVDGTLITEISGNKDVFKIKLADKMKAMDFLSKYSNLLSDEEKLKLDLEYKRLQNRKLGAEIAKINGEDGEQTEDDGFIDALGGTAQEDWADEEI